VRSDELHEQGAHRAPFSLGLLGAVPAALGRRGRADERDETRPEEYDELAETGEPAPAVGAGVA